MNQFGFKKNQYSITKMKLLLLPLLLITILLGMSFEESFAEEK